MQVASLQAATSKLQQNIITTARKAATWAQLGVVSYLSIKQTDVNIISLFGEKVNINKTKQNMDDDELDLFAIASVTVAARECANKTTKS